MPTCPSTSRRCSLVRWEALSSPRDRRVTTRTQSLTAPTKPLRCLNFPVTQVTSPESLPHVRRRMKSGQVKGEDVRRHTAKAPAVGSAVVVTSSVTVSLTAPSRREATSTTVSNARRATSSTSVAQHRARSRSSDAHTSWTAGCLRSVQTALFLDFLSSLQFEGR